MYVKYLILITILNSVQAKIRLFETEGDIEIIGKRFYKKELLTDAYSDPKELSYDPHTRNLFFMYMDEDIQNSGRAYINTVTLNTDKVKGIKYNKATAVDQYTGAVYFGSYNGLYKYDQDTNEAVNIGLYNFDILKIVVRNHVIYLIDANDHMMYAVEDGLAIKVDDWKGVFTFDVDYNDNIHFVTLCGLFCAWGNETIRNNDLSRVYHFMINDEKTLGVTDDAIYEINCKDGKADKVAQLDFIPNSITYGDNGAIFYSIEDSIYKLTPIKASFVYNMYKID